MGMMKSRDYVVLKGLVEKKIEGIEWVLKNKRSEVKNPDGLASYRDTLQGTLVNLKVDLEEIMRRTPK